VATAWQRKERECEMKLNQKIVNAYQPNGAKQWINDDDVAGLRLFVGAKKGKTWWLRFRADGAQLSHKIGSAEAVTVAGARDLALAFLAKLAAGENPHIKPEKPAEKLTLGKFMEENYSPYARANLKSAKETIRRINIDFKDFLPLPIEDITPRKIDAWRNTRTANGIKAATINRSTSALRAALSWGANPTNKFLTSNPLKELDKKKESDSKEIIRYLSKDVL
jgi:hypothetical protein